METPYENEPLLDMADVVGDCPICLEPIGITAYHAHMLENHPVAYITMLATYMPHMQPEDVLNTVFPFDVNGALELEEWYEPGDGDNEENMYEYLLDLCDTIGYHHVGVDETNIDVVAPILKMPALKQQPESGDDDYAERYDKTCPVCLERLCEVEPTRRIVACGHAFCSTCITTWFKTHKWCPVCKKDATSSNQIASISMSSDASDREGPSSSPSDARSDGLNGSPVSAINTT